METADMSNHFDKVGPVKHLAVRCHSFFLVLRCHSNLNDFVFYL